MSWGRASVWALATVGALLLSWGCRPRTEIPTYWDPVFAARPKLQLPPAPDPPAPRAPPAVIAKGPPECHAIYVVSAEDRLYAFHPDDARFELRGELACPGAKPATPFSMAVARTGVAHVLFNDGRLFRVDVTDASCEPTPFRPFQHGFALFGMGYAADRQGGEDLYVVEIGFVRRSRGLARLDTDTYELTPIAPLSDNPGFNIELTPSGPGPLYGYAIHASRPGGTLMQIDVADGTVVEATPLPVGTRSSSLAIGWWGGSFYIFTAIAGGSEVTRHDPKTGVTEAVATIEQRLVGAGVSTCAPDRPAPAARP